VAGAAIPAVSGSPVPEALKGKEAQEGCRLHVARPAFDVGRRHRAHAPAVRTR
jgi:hypothetical protein